MGPSPLHEFWVEGLEHSWKGCYRATLSSLLLLTCSGWWSQTRFVGTERRFCNHLKTTTQCLLPALGWGWADPPLHCLRSREECTSSLIICQVPSARMCIPECTEWDETEQENLLKSTTIALQVQTEAVQRARPELVRSKSPLTFVPCHSMDSHVLHILQIALHYTSSPADLSHLYSSNIHKCCQCRCSPWVHSTGLWSCIFHILRNHCTLECRNKTDHPNDDYYHLHSSVFYCRHPLTFFEVEIISFDISKRLCHFVSARTTQNNKFPEKSQFF